MGDYTTGRLLKRIFAESIHPYRGYVLLAMACMVVVAATTALNAWLIQPVLDDVFIKKNTKMLYYIPFFVIGIAIIKAIAAYIENYLLKSTSQHVICDMQSRLFSHLVHADISFFNTHSPGTLISRFTHDTHVIRSNLVHVLIGGVRELLSAIALIGVMLYQSLTLSLLALVVLPVAVYPLSRLGKRMRKISRNIQAKMAEFSGSLESVFVGIKVTKAFVREQYESSRIRDTLDGLLTLYKKAVRVESFTSPMMELLGGIAVASVIFYGGIQVVDGVTTPGAFFSFITALLLAYKPLKTLSNIYPRIQETSAALQRYYEMRDVKSVVEDIPNAVPLIAKKPDITFENVDFHYIENSPALTQLSLHIPYGQKVAFVGPSGSGKSTIIQLLLKFYLPQKGEIRINTQSLTGVTVSSLREHISYVSQEAGLFEGNLRKNIQYGNWQKDDAALLQAAKDAALDRLLDEMGLETEIGPMGNTLSGGQRQRVAIARTLVKDAPIIVLDEATSALDSQTEARILTHLTQHYKDNTVIAVAHRLSTIKDMDCIYVLDAGSIIEKGTHSTLLKQNGLYASLWKQQSDEKDDEKTAR